ncbi:cold-shock protein [Candidatus Parcubacteria bacterium]|nr:MAG: cold-shock protein [Candidatus Parcubacteria bacterium]
MQGTIKKLTDKNFGFISTSESDKDVFFHASELTDVSFDQLSEGDAVEFELSDTPKGTAATQIKKA